MCMRNHEDALVLKPFRILHCLLNLSEWLDGITAKIKTITIFP